MHIAKFFDTLETLASEIGPRSICEAMGELAAYTNPTSKGTLAQYLETVGSTFNHIVLNSGKTVPEWSINKAFKKNFDDVLASFERGEDPAEVSQRLFDEAITYIPHRIVQTRPFVPHEDGIFHRGQFDQYKDRVQIDEHTGEVRMVAESVESTTLTVKDHVMNRILPAAIKAAMGN